MAGPSFMPSLSGIVAAQFGWNARHERGSPQPTNARPLALEDADLDPLGRRARPIGGGRAGALRPRLLSAARGMRGGGRRLRAVERGFDLARPVGPPPPRLPCRPLPRLRHPAADRPALSNGRPQQSVLAADIGSGDRL